MVFVDLWEILILNNRLFWGSSGYNKSFKHYVFYLNTSRDWRTTRVCIGTRRSWLRAFIARWPLWIFWRFWFFDGRLFWKGILPSWYCFVFGSIHWHFWCWYSSCYLSILGMDFQCFLFRLKKKSKLKLKLKIINVKLCIQKKKNKKH